MLVHSLSAVGCFLNLFFKCVRVIIVFRSLEFMNGALFARTNLFLMARESLTRPLLSF